MSKPLHLLIVEDSEDDALLLLLELRRNGYAPDYVRVETHEEMKQALGRREWDVVISDYVMPRFSGLDALAALNESGLEVPFIIVSGNIGEDIAVGAMKAGASDYILKGNLTRLVPAIERELRDAEVRRARKRAEEERNRLAAAVESSADAIVITDPQRGAIQYVNPAFERITGHKKSEVLGRPLHILDSGKHDEAFYRGIREALKRNGTWTGRLTNRKKDGTLYEEECTYTPITGPAGEVINYVSVKRDITEKLRLESIAQAVESMNNIGYIFSGVRHEIGNPINSVIMNLSLVKERLGELDKPAIGKYVDRALDATGKVEYILRSLTSFNMFEKPELANVDVADFLEKFVALVSEDFGKKGIAVDVSTGGDPGQAFADVRALQQVLLNLFTNAADALNGREEPNISLSASRSGGMIRIRVRDNGWGIPEERLKDLFKPFHTTKTHGTGLGLVIVRKMLAMMNGTVEITSRKDEGTKVDFFIPAGKT